MRISDWSSDVCSSDLSSEVFNIPTILDILHKKIRERVKVTSPDIHASLKAKGCLSGSLFLASFLIGIECISVFLLLHGFDSHEPISRSEEHTSELQSLRRISYAVFCLTTTKKKHDNHTHNPK